MCDPSDVGGHPRTSPWAWEPASRFELDHPAPSGASCDPVPDPQSQIANRKSKMPLPPALSGPIGLPHFLVLAAVLFACGLMTMMVKRNAIGILMGVELILNAANVNLVAFNRYLWAGDRAAGRPALDGQVFAIFVIVLAAAEAAVALAIFLNYYNNFATVDVERGRELRD